MPGGGWQLVLPFPVNQRCVFGNFQIGGNGELFEVLQDLPDAAAFAGLWLWGASGAGVSHLLQASCQHFAERGRSVAYLPLAQLARRPDILDGLERCDLVALDDVQTWAAQPVLEAALMALYQGLLGGKRHLLVGAASPVADSAFALADLRSRFASLATYHVQSLDDAGKAELLRRLAGERGLTLSNAVLRFWLARSDRALDRLLAQLDQLDAAAMQAQRVVTVPLLKQVLGL